MGGFPARRGAGVEHTLAWSEVEKPRGALCAGVLHRNLALGETGQPVYRNRVFQCQGFPTQGSRGDPRRAKPLYILLHRNTAGIDAQRHRRMVVSGCECVLPTLRISCTYEIDPPPRMLVTRFFVGAHLRSERAALAQVAAQQAVDIALRGPTLEQR